MLTQKKVIFVSENRSTEYKEAKKEFEQEVTGWLRVQGTNIDFPVLALQDDVDLSKVIDDFAWMNTKPTKEDNRIVIEGHNLLNVSSNPLITDENHTRFEQLLSFIYPEFAKENKYIEYFDGTETHLYAIYGVSFKRYFDTDPYKFRLSKEEKRDFIKGVRKNSYFDYKLDVSETDELLTLITCTRFFGNTTEYSFTVNARKLRKNEKATNYDMRVKDSYKEIEVMMKGDEANEEV